MPSWTCGDASEETATPCAAAGSNVGAAGEVASVVGGELSVSGLGAAAATAAVADVADEEGAADGEGEDAAAAAVARVALPLGRPEQQEKPMRRGVEGAGAGAAAAAAAAAAGAAAGAGASGAASDAASAVGRSHWVSPVAAFL